MRLDEIDDEEFIELFQEHGPAKLARLLDVRERAIFKKRLAIEGRLGYKICRVKNMGFQGIYPKRLPIDLPNGQLLIASDIHLWPGIRTVAREGFVYMARAIKPKYIILNGDVLDGARISRHARIGWSPSPTISQEKEAVREFFKELKEASPESKIIWVMGNHDFRFETYLSNRAPDMEGVEGLTLADHFKDATFCISAWVNDNVVIKHRFKGGVHATHNNTLWSGKTMVTGHLHQGKVTPFTDYNGTRYGIDVGTLTDPSSSDEGSPSNDYNEDNPQNHRAAFALLTFHQEDLLYPELILANRDGTIDFRGKRIKV